MENWECRWFIFATALSNQKIRSQSSYLNIYTEEGLYDAVTLAIALSNRQLKIHRNRERLTPRTKHESVAGDRQQSRFKQLPSPAVYTLTHVSQAYRTASGRVKPSIFTYAIRGQWNRRLRLAVRENALQPRVRIPVGKARRFVIKGRGSRAKQTRQKFKRMISFMRLIERGLIGPNKAFFENHSPHRYFGDDRHRVEAESASS
jgi:hypothetical protein